MTNGATARMKRAAIILLTLGVTTWTACGGGDSNSNENPVSKVKNRVFVSNAFYSTTVASRIDIIDASRDRHSGFTITTPSQANEMKQSPDGKMTVLYTRYGSAFFAISNETEAAVSSSVSLGNATDSWTLASDNKTLYAAVRNYINSGALPGAVQVVDYVTPKIVTTIPVANARWLALSHSGKQLVVFSDTSDGATLIDVSDTTNYPKTTLTGFSRPVAAFYSSDDTKLYVLSCGTQCGGAASATGAPAFVTEVTLATGALRTVDVQGATVGLLDNSTLYVAGAPGGVGGTVQAIDTAAMTAKPAVNIGQGYHTILRLINNKLWIGAKDCQTKGCLSIYDPQSGSVVVDNPANGSASKGNVTGMAYLDFRNLVYVCEGGEVRLYDMNGNEQATELDIVGEAYDVAYVPQ